MAALDIHHLMRGDIWSLLYGAEVPDIHLLLVLMW